MSKLFQFYKIVFIFAILKIKRNELYRLIIVLALAKLLL